MVYPEFTYAFSDRGDVTGVTKFQTINPGHNLGAGSDIPQLLQPMGEFVGSQYRRHFVAYTLQARKCQIM